MKSIHDSMMDAALTLQRMFHCSFDEMPPAVRDCLRWHIHPATKERLIKEHGGYLYRISEDPKQRDRFRGIEVESMSGIPLNEVRIAIVCAIPIEHLSAHKSG